MFLGKVALDRITEFLQKVRCFPSKEHLILRFHCTQTELLDTFSKDGSTALPVPEGSIEDAPIGIRSASFTWNIEDENTSSRRRKFALTVEDELLFKRGGINLIVGQTGCGKTSLLMALLGEMHYTPLDSRSFVSLPRDRGVAYHAQDSWVLNDTIKVSLMPDGWVRVTDCCSRITYFLVRPSMKNVTPRFLNNARLKEISHSLTRGITLKLAKRVLH